MVSEGLALAGLILNILILPGLGTIIMGDTKTGVWQLILFLIGIPLIFVFFIGIPVMIAAWVWALITSVKTIKKAK